jgi:hypothetical protein
MGCGRVVRTRIAKMDWLRGGKRGKRKEISPQRTQSAQANEEAGAKTPLHRQN